MTTARWPPRYAARVARVTASGGHEGDDTIMFASGDAYPESLPDVSEFAQLAATKYRTETLRSSTHPAPACRSYAIGSPATSRARASL